MIHHAGTPGYFHLTEAIFRRMPAGFVVLTGEAKRELIAAGKPAARIRVIPHGVYDFFRDADADAAGEDERKEILFFGRIEPYKGLPILLDAWAELAPRFPDWKLVIAGGGDVSGLRERLNVPRIELINRFVSDAEVGALMRRAAIVALPYLSATQSGVISTVFLFEKAIAATAVDSIPNLIRDRKSTV